MGEKIRHGERISVDGEVAEGTTSVDELSFTEESAPVTKEKDHLFWGNLILKDFRMG